MAITTAEIREAIIYVSENAKDCVKNAITETLNDVDFRSDEEKEMINYWLNLLQTYNSVEYLLDRMSDEELMENLNEDFLIEEAESLEWLEAHLMDAIGLSDGTILHFDTNLIIEIFK